MARALRIQFPGAIYHVTFRGNERRAIFRGDGDRQQMLDKLAEERQLTQVRLYLVCLMPNHVHLLLETPRGNLAEFMGRLLTAYAVYFNRRYRRVGHLTQGRYRAQLVEGDEYLLKLSRYIHLNPVCGKRWEGVAVGERIKELRENRWSTYRSYAGLEPKWKGIDYAPILATVTGTEAEAEAAYQAYVETGLATSDTAFRVLYRQARLSVGSSGFVAKVMRLHEQALTVARRREDVALRRTQSGRSPEEVIEVVAVVLGVPASWLKQRRRNSVLRGAGAWALCRHSGRNQRAIAEILGIGTGAAVSSQIAKWRRLMAKEACCREMAAEIDRRLKASG